MIRYDEAYLRVADLSEATLAPEHAADIAAWVVANQHYSLADRLSGAPGREARLAREHRKSLARPKWADLFGIDPDYCDGMPVDQWLEKNRGEA